MRCAVLGSPIEHSLSPTLHRAAYRELGLGWQYDAVDVVDADLAAFLTSCDASWRGLSLTMPLKRTVIPLLDQAEPLVKHTGVANTVVFEGARRLGYNTDIPGAIRAMQEKDIDAVDSALLLGGGATAASLGWALADLGCRSFRLLVRNAGTAQETLRTIERHPTAPQVTVAALDDPEAAEPADVIASTIPAAAQHTSMLSALQRTDSRLVFDALYDPWPTPLAGWAQRHGIAVVNGLDLLVHQAALQVKLMSGELPSIDPMRAAGLAALEARHRT